MGVQRVGRALHRLEVDLETGFLGMFHHRGISPHRTFLATEFAFQIGTAVHPFSRHVGVKLERVPFDRERVVRLAFQCAVQMGLADIAPRANRVGHDIKLDRLGHRCAS